MAGDALPLTDSFKRNSDRLMYAIVSDSPMTALALQNEPWAVRTQQISVDHLCHVEMSKSAHEMHVKGASKLRYCANPVSMLLGRQLHAPPDQTTLKYVQPSGENSETLSSKHRRQTFVDASHASSGSS